MKLTSKRHSLHRIVLACAITVSLVGLVSVAVRDSCEVVHVDLLHDINAYEQDPDPDVCYALLERIDSFNARCEVRVDVLDCG